MRAQWLCSRAENSAIQKRSIIIIIIITTFCADVCVCHYVCGCPCPCMRAHVVVHVCMCVTLCNMGACFKLGIAHHLTLTNLDRHPLASMTPASLQQYQSLSWCLASAHHETERTLFHPSLNRFVPRSVCLLTAWSCQGKPEHTQLLS